MTTSQLRVSKDLILNLQTLSKTAAAVPVIVPTNHIAVIDCSGSMSYDLPKIREQLKKKLPKLLRDGDTFSAIWFSGRNEFGTLLEAEPVNTLADLKDVNQAIDRWLRPVGMTGFKQPLEEVSALIDRVAKKRPGTVNSLLFMSDGCDNQSSRAEILKAIEKASSRLGSATFIEYGYYADRPMMAAMAEKSGGSVIFADDFDKFVPTMEAVLGRQLVGGKKVEVPVKGDVIGGFAFAIHDGDLLTFAVENGVAQVPEAVKRIHFLTTGSGKVDGSLETIAGSVSSGGSGKEFLDGAFAALSLFSLRMKPEIVFPLLKSLGDVRFIENFSSCFGKQKYTEFMESAKQAALGNGRFESGFNPNLVPREDAFTVLELLRVLAEDEGNRLLLDHPSFKYSRVSRGRVDSSDHLTTEESHQIVELTQQMAVEKDVTKLKELTAKIAAITAAKVPALKFVADEVTDGYGIRSLTYNEDRPNVSVLVKKFGTVDLSDRLPDNFKTAPDGFKAVPTQFRSLVYRNYTIIRDGLVNVEQLPVRLTRETAQKLEGKLPAGAIGILSVTNRQEGDFLIDLRKLPIINRSMVKNVSAKALFEKAYELEKARAAQKVFNTYKKEHFPRKSEGFTDLYGAEAATWLKEQGLTDFGGFAPKGIQAESTDVYTGKELRVSLKGLSSLPKVADVKTRIASGKMTPSAALMAPSVTEVEKFLASDPYKKSKDPAKLFELWLDGQTTSAVETARKLICEIAQIKFGVVVGQTWFSEFSSLDQNSMTLTVDGNTVECKVEMKEVDVKI
jgi:hypothetical protein